MTDTPKRKCSKCGLSYPETTDYWYQYGGRFETRCKHCKGSRFTHEKPEPVPEGWRRCSKCGVPKPETTENFYWVETFLRRNGQRIPYSRWQACCIECDLKHRREKREQVGAPERRDRAHYRAHRAAPSAETRATPAPKPTPRAVKAKAAGKPKARAQANEVRELIAWLDRRRIGSPEMPLTARLDLLQERDRDLQRAFIGQRAQIVELRRMLEAGEIECVGGNDNP